MVEGTPLLRERRVYSLTEGSNPSLSASNKLKPALPLALWVFVLRLPKPLALQYEKTADWPGRTGSRTAWRTLQ